MNTPKVTKHKRPERRTVRLTEKQLTAWKQIAKGLGRDDFSRGWFSRLIVFMADQHIAVMADLEATIDFYPPADFAVQNDNEVENS